MDILGNLTDRLRKVKLVKDPSETKALRDWLEEGGLESLKPALIAYTKEIDAMSLKPITLSIRRVDDWKWRSFEVYSYNTIEELKKIVGESLEIKEGFDLRFPYKSKGKTIGEIIGDRDTNKIEVIAIPHNSWYIIKDKTITMPVEVVRNNKPIDYITIPLTRKTTGKDLLDIVRKQYPAVKSIVFKYPETGEQSVPFGEELAIWYVWIDSRLGPVIVNL